MAQQAGGSKQQVAAADILLLYPIQRTNNLSGTTHQDWGFILSSARTTINQLEDLPGTMHPIPVP